MAGLVTTAAALLTVLLAVPQARAADFRAQILRALDERVRPWLSDPVVVEAVVAQNARTASLSEAEIDALDRQWIEEARSGGVLVNTVANSRLSRFLRARKEQADGLFIELFVMDARGLTVGMSDVTSDYMQGDEDKWRRTYPLGPGAVFVDDLAFDPSTTAIQTQVSATLADPATGRAIGAVTVGINLERLPPAGG